MCQLKLRSGYGQTVREARLQIGISMNYLAMLCGLDSGHLSRIERGLHEPSQKTIIKIENNLNRFFI